MTLKRKDPGRAYSPARKALSRSGIGLCRSPRRGLSTSFQASSKPVTTARPGARPGPRPGASSKGASANMKVVVRVRPLSKREEENHARVIVDVVDDKMVVFDPKREEESFFFHGAKQRGRDMLKKQNKHTQYLFDRVFGPESSNEDVFDGSTKSIVVSVLDGFNCSVFVYGATGAGKTFTMLGTQENPGITFRTMVDLFQQMEGQKSEKAFEIGVSYLEVYNETVRDLLNPTSGALHLREDGGGVLVAGLKMERIADPHQMFELLEHGNRNRSQHPTDANAESSRSHAVFQVFIKIKTKANGQTKMVKLSMIDLAGSERGAATGCTGVRFKEGSNINKSLLALGNCINALADGLRHIPYRDSKLTRLLKDSLGGNCQTVMIANLAPAHQTYEDTHNTLKYATRAKSIKFQIKRNIVSVELHVSHYIKMVEDLQAENERLKAENARLMKEHEDFKFVNEAAPVVSPLMEPSPPSQSHLPPVIAAAVAAIKDKLKPEVSTSSVGVNTSPFKETLTNENLERLKDEAKKLYSDKARLHHRYMNMDSSDKVLRLRIKLKQRVIERVQAMSTTPSRTDQTQLKVDKSVGQFQGRLTSARECQEVVSVEENEINERLNQIEKELSRLGVLDQAAPYLKAFELEFMNQELLLKCQHQEKLVEYINLGFERHDEIVQKVSALFRKYRNLVRGHGHMNQELEGEHEAVMRGLEGMKSVQWDHERDEIFHETDQPCNAAMPSKSRRCTTNSSNECKHPEVDLSAQFAHPSTAPSSLLAIDEVKSMATLQSPLCTSSSNPLNVTQDLDTASMLDTLNDLDSKVESILNTSVSSTGVEIDWKSSEPLSYAVDNEKPLNITFDGGANLDSTFTKEEETVETKVNLNETFEKTGNSNGVLVSNSEGDLNGTFSLDDVPPKVNDPEPEARPKSLGLTAVSISPSIPSGSPSLIKSSSHSGVSPRLRILNLPASLSPASALAKKEVSYVSPKSISNLSATSKLLSSSSPSLISNVSIPMKQITSPTPNSVEKLLVKKPGSTTSTQSPSFAVPNAVPPAKSLGLKRVVAGGIGEKRKALSSNLVTVKGPGGKPLSITRKVVGSNPKVPLNLNTPSKVKLAWNKENRNANTVTAIRPVITSKHTKPVGSSKPVVKSSAPPLPFNDTFTK